jgi:DNA-binding GntR family transcriptional regulator
MATANQTADCVAGAVPARRASLHQEVLGHVRDFIVQGHLRPGERISERDLCETLQVSRTPLREALKVLAAEGLVELLPNRGAHVRRFTAADARHLFEALAGLEFATGQLACERITDQSIAAVEQLHYAMYAHYMRRELPEYFRLNQAIHDAFLSAADSPALEAASRGLDSRIRQLRYAANQVQRDRWGDAMREHEQMLDALRRRDGQELGLLLFHHMRRKCEAACEGLLADAVADATEQAHAA